MKRVVASLLLCCLTWVGPAEARLYDDMVKSGELRVAVYRDFPPYSFQRDGEAAGVDVRLAQTLADTLGLSLSLIWMTPDETLEDDLRNYVWKGHYLDKDESNPFHQKKVADLMMRVPYDREYAYMRDSTGEIINEQVVMFSPYQQERWQIAFNQARIEKVSTIAVFQYEPIGAELDSLPDFYLTSAFGGRLRDKVRHFKTVAEAFVDMQQGGVSAVMGMQGEIEWQLFSHNDDRLKKAENGFPMIGKQQWDVGMAVAQDNRQLAYEVEEKVGKMIQEGTMATLFSEYGLTHRVPDYWQY